MNKLTKEHSLLQQERFFHHKEKLTIIILRVSVSISLLAGGLILLALRIAGWSLIFGLPMMVIGTVFIIYTYDEVLGGASKDEEKDY